MQNQAMVRRERHGSHGGLSDTDSESEDPLSELDALWFRACTRPARPAKACGKDVLGSWVRHVPAAYVSDWKGCTFPIGALACYQPEAGPCNVQVHGEVSPILTALSDSAKQTRSAAPRAHEYSGAPPTMSGVQFRGVPS